VPGIRIEGNASPPRSAAPGATPTAPIDTGPRGRGRNSAPGPSSFEQYVLQGMDSGQNPFTSLSAQQQANLASSPSYLSGQWQGAAQSQLSRMIADAVRQLRVAGGQGGAYELAVQAAAMLGAQGALTPSLSAGMGALQNVANRYTPGAGALVPYQAPGMPVPIISPSYAGFSPSGPPISLRAPNSLVPYQSFDAQAVPLLRSIATDTHAERVLEGEILNATRNGLTVSSGHGGAGGFTGTTIHGAWYQWGGGALPPGGGPGGGPGGPPGGGGGGPLPPGGPGGPPGGGGGGGGGRRPRGPAGGGRFFGALGLGTTAGALGLTSTPWGLGLDVAYELATLPQHIGGAEAGALSAATPYMNMVRGSMAMSRAGGFGWGDTGPLRQFFPGGYATPPWMSALGVGPQQALQRASAFPILPSDSKNAAGLAHALSTFDFMGPLSGLGDQARASASNAARYGFAAPTFEGAQSWGLQMAHVLEAAVAQGMDRASVMQSIDERIAALGRGGAAGVAPSSIQDWALRFASAPGGLTGEAALRTAAGLDSANAQVGQDPVRSMMYASAVARTRTSKSLAALMGQRNYDQLTKDNAGKQEVQLYLQAANSGDYPTAERIMRDMLDGNSRAIANNLTQSSFYSGMSAPQRAVATSNVTNMRLHDYLEMQANPPNAQSRLPNAGYSNQFAAGGMGYDNSKTADYRTGLLAMGVRPDLVTAVLTQSYLKKINPLYLGAIMMNESTGGTNKAMGAWGMPANVNVMQMTSGTGAMLGFSKPTSAVDSIAQGAALAAYNLNAEHGNVYKATQDYAGTAGFAANNYAYWGNIQHNMQIGGAGGNIPFGMNSDAASAQQAIMAASATSFAEMNQIIPRLNAGLESVASAADKTTAALSRLTKTANKIGSMTLGTGAAAPMQ
jgi:hypothetical protein